MHEQSCILRQMHCVCVYIYMYINQKVLLKRCFNKKKKHLQAFVFSGLYICIYMYCIGYRNGSTLIAAVDCVLCWETSASVFVLLYE